MNTVNGSPPMKKTIKPTFIGILIVHFPTVHLAIIFLSLVCAYLYPGPEKIVLVLVSIYLFPLLAHRIHDVFFPLKETRTIIPSGDYPPWWGSYHIQKIFIALPFLEAPLRLIPGAFSLWLRLWGSQIGKKLHWPPLMEIADRSLLDIGHGTVIGQHTGLYCHVLNPSKDGRILLYVKKIRIGHGCFIGSGSLLGPGVTITDGTKLDIKTEIATDKAQANLAPKETL